MEFFAEYGYLGLFVAAFLAATILPLSSELVLSALIAAGLSPLFLVLIATSGNVLGSLVNYALGYWLNTQVAQQKIGISTHALQRAERRFQKYGLFSLCFAWVPVIGDPLTLVAGILKVRLIWFLILVTLGKMIRYVVIAYLAQQLV